MAAPNFCDGKCHIRGGDHRPAQVARTGRVPGCNTLNTKLECENAWACNYGNMDDIDGEITCNLPYGASCHWNGRSCALAGAGSSVIHNCGRSVDDDVCKEKKCNGVERDTICGRHPSGTKVSENECDELYTTSGISEAGKAYQCVWSRRGTGSCDSYLTSSSNITGWEANSKDNNKCIIPVDCVGTWGDWGDCSADCGGGTQTRVYSISTPAFKGGSECPSPETRDCNTQACPVDCVGTWGDWGDCSADCGGGTQTRVYSISTPAFKGGSECPSPETRDCNTQACPVDCVGTWGDWGDCSADCGGGTQTRDYSIITNASNGGLPCPSSPETQDCNTQECPAVNCVGGWGSGWSECDERCGGGTQTRVYSISTPADNGGTDCDYSDGFRQEKSCNIEPCPIDCVEGWGGWTPSTCPCTPSTQTNTYLITPPQHGGERCGIPPTQTTQERDCPESQYPSTCNLDCNNIWGGSAYIDPNCPVTATGQPRCVGGNTQEPCDQDCSGTWGGSAVIDECGVCGGSGIPEGYCDCYGNVDEGCGCGSPGEDECGVCGGDGSSCADCAGIPNGPTVLDICGVCGGGSSNCSDCWSPCLATDFIEEVPTAICENAEDRIWDPPRDTGVPLPPQNTECIPEDCGAGQGNCPFKCQGTWGVCDGGNCLQDQCDSDCNEEFYYLPSPPPPAPPMEHGTCEQPAGTKRYCQTGANNCPLPADCTYEPVMSECYGCNFDSSGNFISSSGGMERQEYRIRTPIYGDMDCTHSGSDIPLEDKDPYVTMDGDGNYTLLMENPCSDPNPSCTSCKPLNQLFQEEGVSTKEELCNNVFLDIRRLNCTPDGITIDSYNINNMDGLKKFTNINKGGDENYDIFERDTFDPQKYILKNKSMECFHNIFEGSGTLCDNIFLPDNTLGGLKYVHNLNDCIDSNVNDWSNILTRADPYENQGNWFNLDQEEIPETP